MDWVLDFVSNLINYLNKYETPFEINIEDQKKIFDLEIAVVRITPKIPSLPHFPNISIKSKLMDHASILALYRGNVNLSYLPIEIIYTILFYLPYEDVKNLCFFDHDLDKRICQSDIFWSQKFTFDNDMILPLIPGQMEQFYLNSGQLWGLGKNYYGQAIGLRNNSFLHHFKNVIIGDLNNKITEMACGDSYSLVIDYNNDLWSFGNVNQILSYNTVNKVKIDGINLKAKAVACGKYDSFIIGLNNVLYFWENLGELKLVQDTWEDITLTHHKNGLKIKKVTACGKRAAVIDLENHLLVFGGKFKGVNPPSKREGFQYIIVNNEKLKVKDVTCGPIHTMFIDLDDNVWSFGSNYRGGAGLIADTEYTHEPKQIIINGLPLKAKRIISGYYHYSIIIDLEDYAYKLNYDNLTPIILNNKQIKIKKGSIQSQIAFLIDLNNDCWRYYINLDTFLPIVNFKVKDVSSGKSHILLTRLY